MGVSESNTFSLESSQLTRTFVLYLVTRASFASFIVRIRTIFPWLKHAISNDMHCQFNLSFEKRKNTHELHLLVVLRFTYFRELNYWVECRRAESASENQGDISFPWGFSRRDGLRGLGIAVTWANTTINPFNSIIPNSLHTWELGGFWERAGLPVWFWTHLSSLSHPLPQQILLSQFLGWAGLGSSGLVLFVLHQLSLKTVHVGRLRHGTLSYHFPSVALPTDMGNPWAESPFRENSLSIEKLIRPEMEKSSLKNKKPWQKYLQLEVPSLPRPKGYYWSFISYSWKWSIIRKWAIYFLGSNGSYAHFLGTLRGQLWW